MFSEQNEENSLSDQVEEMENREDIETLQESDSVDLTQGVCENEKSVESKSEIVEEHPTETIDETSVEKGEENCKCEHLKKINSYNSIMILSHQYHPRDGESLVALI